MADTDTPEKQKSLLSTLKNLGIALAFIVGAIYVWDYVSNVAIYIVISLVISAILKPSTNYLSGIQIYGFSIPRALAILISFAIMFGVIGLFVYLFVPLISEQSAAISAIDFEKLVNRVSEPIDNVESFLIENNIVTQDKGFIVSNTKDLLSNILDPGKATSLLNNLISITGSFFIGLVAVLFISFFFLYEKNAFRKYFISLIPNKYFEVSIAALSKTERLLSNYLIGLLLQMSSIFTVASIGLVIAGVKYALTIALFAAVANLIPFLGPILGASFGILVGISLSAINGETTEIFILVVKIVIVFATVQITDNIFLQPIIFSKSVKAHPLIIFLAVFVGGSVTGGPLGMIAAIPALTIFKVSFGEFYRGYKQYQIFRT